MTPLTAIPTLDELAASPERAATVPAPIARVLILRAAAATTALATRLYLEPVESAAEAPDHTLTIEQAALRLQVAPKTLATWTRTKPEWRACVVSRSRNRILLSAARFEAVMRRGERR